MNSGPVLELMQSVVTPAVWGTHLLSLVGLCEVLSLTTAGRRSRLACSFNGSTTCWWYHPLIIRYHGKSFWGHFSLRTDPIRLASLWTATVLLLHFITIHIVSRTYMRYSRSPHSDTPNYRNLKQQLRDVWQNVSQDEFRYLLSFLTQTYTRMHYR